MSAPSFSATIAHQIIRDNMTCGFCRRDLYDCRCPQNVECRHCEADVETADFLGRICDESPTGEHEFVDRSPEG